jgi:hypothetical protein
VAPATLYFVRRKTLIPSSMSVTPPPVGVGIEGVFADRAEAEACMVRREQEEARRGDWSALFELLSYRGPDGLREESDFEPGVYDDWLADHDIPDPKTIWNRWQHTYDSLHGYLEKLSRNQIRALYAAMHRFRFFEIVEAPLVVGDYLAEHREAWENDLPVGPPAPPGVHFNAAMTEAMLQQTLQEIADHFGLEVPPPVGDDENIPF